MYFIPSRKFQTIAWPISALGGALAAGVAVAWRQASSVILGVPRASVYSAPTTGNVSLDILAGGVSILSTKITILQNQKSSLFTGTTQPVVIPASQIVVADTEMTLSVLTAQDAQGGVIQFDVLFLT
jgi:hypothetical protein